MSGFIAKPPEEQAAEHDAEDGAEGSNVEQSLVRLKELKRSYEFLSEKFLAFVDRALLFVKPRQTRAERDAFDSFVDVVESETAFLDDSGSAGAVGDSRVAFEEAALFTIGQATNTLCSGLRSARRRRRLEQLKSDMPTLLKEGELDWEDGDRALAAYEKLLLAEDSIAEPYRLESDEAVVTILTSESIPLTRWIELYASINLVFAATGVSDVQRLEVRSGSWWERWGATLRSWGDSAKALINREEVKEAASKAACESFDAATKGAAEKRKADAEADLASAQADMARIQVEVENDPDVKEARILEAKAKAAEAVFKAEQERLKALDQMDGLFRRVAGPIRAELLRNPMFRLVFDVGESQFGVACSEDFVYLEEDGRVKKLARRPHSTSAPEGSAPADSPT